MAHYAVAQENRPELPPLCAYTLSSLHMYVHNSCNTTPTAAVAYIYMHGLRSTLPREEGPKWALKEVATDSPAAEDKEDGDSTSSEEESSDCFGDNELLA